MSASAFHVTRTSTGIRVWFTVLNADRTLRTGLVGGNFTVTLIRDDDAAVSNPAVSESTQLSGVYFFDVPSGFLTTNGNNYVMVIQVTLAPVDAISAPLFVTQQLWDQLETEASAATREATNTAEHGTTLTAVGLVETEASAATREATNTAEHGTTLTAVGLNESGSRRRLVKSPTRRSTPPRLPRWGSTKVKRARQLGATNTAEHAATLAAVGLTETEAAALARANAILAAIALGETEAAAAAREVTNTAEHAATLAAVGLNESEASAATREATNTAEHAATLTAVGLNESEAAAATRESTNTAEHAATLAAIAAGVSPDATTAARILYLLTHAGGVNGNKMNHTRAVIGTPGRAFSDDTTVDQTVTQVDANTATFEQVP